VASRNLLDSTYGRFLTFGVLYICEGIPYGFTSIAMVAFMRREGLSLEQIGAFVGALFLPWAFKWAWAPLIDLVKLHRLGGRQGWILFCTAMMILTLLFTAAVDFTTSFPLLLAMIVLNNFFCATQDVAIDSLAVNTLPEEERGRGNGVMFGGQYLGMALGGGVAVFVYGLWGFGVTLAYISGLLLINLLFVLFFVRDPFVDRNAPRGPAVLSQFADSFKAFLRELSAGFLKSGPGPKVGLVFALLPVGAFALAYATLSTIQVDYGLAESQIAELTVYNTVAAAFGCLFGGWLGDRFGLKLTLGLTYVLTTVPTLVLAAQISAVGLAAVPLSLFFGLIVAHGLVYGMSFGVHSAIFMGMTNPAVAATQFTAFMALTNLAISIGNYWQGVVAERFDYAMVLYVDALLAFVALSLIPFLRSREAAPAQAAVAGAAP
jgi:PAT family beta-lactamase induction signal transducer AmpG